MKRSFLFSFLFLLPGLGAVSCGGGDHPARTSETNPSRSGLRAVCTTTVVADLVRDIGGPDVSVTTLLGPGRNPHDWNPSKEDRRELERADIIFMNGLGLEAGASGALGRAGRSRPIVAVADSIHPTHLIPDPANEERFDPHVWFDPALWLRASYVVCRSLSDADAVHESGFRARLDAFVGAMGPIVQAAEATLDSVPSDRRVIASTHDGLAYFARAFHCQVTTPARAEAEIRGRVKGDPLVEILVSRRIPVLFVTTVESPKYANDVAAAVRKRGQTVRVVEGLFVDAFDAPGTPAGTWAGALRANVRMIAASSDSHPDGTVPAP